MLALNRWEASHPSIHLRILKLNWLNTNPIIIISFTPFDPSADTETLIKLSITTPLTASHPSIHLRILKRCSVKSDNKRLHCFTPFDPSADTETSNPLLRTMHCTQCFTPFDPSADTETSRFPSVRSICIKASHPSIHLRILKLADDEIAVRRAQCFTPFDPSADTETSRR